MRVNKNFNLSDYSISGWLTRRAPKQVLVKEVSLEDDEELRVYIDESFDTSRFGLIYCDQKFLQDLKTYLRSKGYPDDVDYSEQGMQGDDYVSFDAGPSLVKALSTGY